MLYFCTTMNRNRNTLFILALFAFFILVCQVDIQAQCAMCKAGAESSLKDNPNSIARGLNSGILYLMAVPYLLIAFLFRKQITKLVRSKFGKAAKTVEE
jgi:hypothetical protein